jgi:hypothetical protein
MRNGPNGSFSFQGLSRGSYQIVVQNAGDDGPYYSAGSVPMEIGAVSAKTSLPFGRRALAFDLRRIGINVQLSKRAVHIVAGTSVRVAIEGPGLKENELRFGSTNEGIVLVPLASDAPDFGKNTSILAFELSVSRSVRPGTYSIFAEDRSGSRRYLVGAISIDAE